MTMLRNLALALGMVMGSAHAATMAPLLGATLEKERGGRAGTLADAIVDVNAGRVLYFIIDADGRYYSVPVRALGEDRRVDMREAGEIASGDAISDARFRRATKLIGQELRHPQPGGANRIGTIRDIEFDLDSGRIERVIVGEGQERFGFGPGVLAQGRFPPLEAGQRSYAGEDELGNRGYLRGEPSDERRQLQR